MQSLLNTPEAPAADISVSTQSCILDKLLSQPTKALKSIPEGCDSVFTKTTNFAKAFKMRYDVSPSLLKNIMMEHCYARPCNWRRDVNFLRPTKTLLMRNNAADKNDKLIENLDESEIDAESCEGSVTTVYDSIKAKWFMNECERHVAGIRQSDDWDNWEESVPKMHWSSIQHNLFASAVKILNDDRIGRLAYHGHPNEAALRRTVVDVAVKRYRSLLCKYLWDAKLVQWLHELFLDHLSAPYLGAYLDILQTEESSGDVFGTFLQAY